MSGHAESASILSLTAQIVSAHLSNNRVETHALPDLIRSVHATLGGLSDAPAADGASRPAWPGATALTAAGGLVAVAVFMLVMGAAYERLASAREPIAPPVIPLPDEGGIDA